MSSGTPNCTYSIVTLTAMKVSIVTSLKQTQQPIGLCCLHSHVFMFTLWIAVG